MINCFLITVIFVIVTDMLHFWQEFSPYIKSWMTGGKFRSPIKFKLFECSTCQSWWVNLAYIIIIGKFSIPMVVYILLLAWVTPMIAAILTFIQNLFFKFINKIAEKINI